MTTYSVPYTFVAGTKATAEEVNANFSYIAGVLDTISAARKPFCVNEGPRTPRGKETILAWTNTEVSTQVGGNYPKAIITKGDGISVTLTESVSTKVNPTKYASILPLMTAASQSDIAASANSESASHEAWYAFDKDPDTYWNSFVGVSNASLIVQILKAEVASVYRINVKLPSRWTLYGSVDSVVWIPLDSYFTDESAIITRTLPGEGNYSFYKLEISAAESEYQVRVAELDLFKIDPSGSISLKETQNLYLTETSILAYRNTCFRSVRKPAGKRLYSAIIPEMKSNIVPSGYTISASGFTALNPPYLAMDRDSNTYWESDSSRSVNYIQVQLPSSVNAKACKITLGKGSNAVGDAIRKGYLQGSNNGSTWFNIYNVEDVTWSYAGESKYLFFDSNTSKYSYYRLIGYDSLFSLAEFQLFSYADNGEYYLGEAEVNDVWFYPEPPYSAKIYKGSDTWEVFDGVPVGTISLNASGTILTGTTNPYNQNGLNVDAYSTKEYAGNLVTYDSFVSNLGEFGSVQLPNGLIYQWGKDVGNARILFPAVFPNELFSVTLTPVSSSGITGATVYEPDVSGFTIKNSVHSDGSAIETDVENYWLAIGR